MKAVIAILVVLALGTGLFLVLTGGESRGAGQDAIAPVAAPSSPEENGRATEDMASARQPAPELQEETSRTSLKPQSKTSRRKEAPARARLSGRLMSESGPVSGAQLVYQSNNQPMLEIASNKRGDFTVVFDKVQEPGILSIRARGYALFELGIGRLSPGENRALGNLHLAKGVIVEGVVLAENGSPIADAMVSAASTRNAVRDYARLLTVQTDARGRFRLEDAPRGSVRLEARAKGHGSRALKVAAPSTDVIISLVNARSLTVEVRDRGGKPVRGAEVRLQPGFEDALSETLKTNEKGIAAFDQLGATSWTLLVSEDNHRPFSQQDVEGQGHMYVELDPWPSIVGRVATPSGDAPPPGTRVFAAHRTRVTGRMPPSGEGHAPEADGSFRISPVFPGGYEVIVDAPGYARTRSSELNIPIEGTVRAGVITLMQGGLLELRVDVPGNKLEGGKISIFSDEPHPGARWNAAEKSPFQIAEGTPDASGVVLFEGLEPGMTWIVARIPDHLPFVGGPYVITPERTLSPPPIRPEIGGHLAGVVRFASGDPVADVMLLVRGGTVDGVIRCHSDEAGRFNSPALPTGRYRVWARVARPGQSPLASEVDAKVTAGSTTELVIEM